MHISCTFRTHVNYYYYYPVSIRFYLFIFPTDGLISCHSYRVYGMRIKHVYNAYTIILYTQAQHMCLCIGNENRLFCGREPVSPAEEFLHLSDLTCERSAHRSTAVRTLYSI